MIDWIVEPLNYAFMVRGLIAALLVGIICAVSGTYVVLRGLAFFGDALAHSILPGIAIGYLVTAGERHYLFWYGLAAALLSALTIGLISQSSKLKEDTSIGIIFTGMFALGIALISSVRDYSMDLTHFLFGNVLGVSKYDLWVSAVFGMMILALHLLFYKEFRVLAFDAVLAKTLRLPIRFLNYLQLTMIAVVIVVSLQTVGIALMAAMMITPAAMAFLLTKRLWLMMVLAVVIASFSGISGLYASYYINISSGASIVLVATLLFLITWFIQLLRRHFKPMIIQKENR